MAHLSAILAANSPLAPVKRLARPLIIALSLICAAPTTRAAPPAQSNTEVKTMQIRLTIGAQSAIATIDDNATARDFLTMLPLTLPLEDYAATEKITYLPRKLSTQGAPAGIDPDVGDITYYAPWGNVAIFYRDFGYASGLIRLGHIDSGIDALKTPGASKITIEVIGQ